MKKQNFLQDFAMKIYKTPFTNRLLRNIWYSYVAIADHKKIASFLNYGYQSNLKQNLKLSKKEKKDLYSIQLYHYVASGTNLSGKNVLEIGCGKGGGANYLAKSQSPKKYVATDINKAEINFASKLFKQQNNLTFQVSDAQNLSFPNEKFDVIINVESAHHYDNLKKFFKEVLRVLRPKGKFLMASYWPQNTIKKVENKLNASGLKLISSKDITSHVAKSLRLDSNRRREMIHKSVPEIFWKLAEDFAGVEGTILHNSFKNKDYIYKYYVLEKNKIKK